MVAPRFRSRTFRRVKVRTPSGRVVLTHKPRKKGKAQCGSCGCVLAGTSTGTLSKMKHSKTKKRPQRPYGGVLCSKCSRILIVKKARQA
ncbi:50S ribosomal protein L34e [Candidatus Woesearchaeota archaeon]|nr:50S ribosomal protein L34e [Candidatus Woesearchaeota archaeon]